MLPRGYGIIPGQQKFITESYVCVPPAFWIVDEWGDVFTLGIVQATEHDTAYYAFNILRNGEPTGEFGHNIEYRRGKVRIHTITGWKTWNGVQFL